MTTPKMSENKKEYLLSIVLCGRNDNYLGDFKYRITTAINYLCRNAKKIGRLNEIEVVVVDWNSETPLSKTLLLLPEACEVTKFIIVPPKIASEYNADGQVFHATCALNAGIRRAKAKFIMLIPADILITSTSLQNLLLLLEGKLDPVFDPKKTMLNIGRKLILWQTVKRKPSLDEWDRYLQLHNRHLVYYNDYPGLASGLGGILLSKRIWKKSRALLENLYGWGWSDIELGFRINQNYPSVDLSYFGVIAYDMQQRLEGKGNRYHNPHHVSYFHEAGNIDWGLKKYSLEIQISNYNQDTKPELTTNASKIVNINKHPRELLDGLADNVIRKHVLTTILNANVDLAEWESLCLLSWYSLNFYPRTYIDFGIKKDFAAIAVASACPNVEIYGIDPWQANKKQELFLQPDIFSCQLQRTNYQGYMWFLTGDYRTAFQRLLSSSIGYLSIDLAMIRGDMFVANVIQQLKDLVPHLAPRGVIVYTHSSANRFYEDWSEMKSKFTQLIYLQCKSGKTGMMLSPSFKNSAQRSFSDMCNDLVIDLGSPPPADKIKTRLRMLYRALKEPSG